MAIKNRYYDETQGKAYQIGYRYMKGEINIGDVEHFLNTDTLYVSRKERANLVAQGARAAEAQGVAKQSRVQPEQEPMHFGPRRRNPGKGGKLADRPEHTKWKPAPKAPEKPATKTRRGGERSNALNAYDVKAQRKKDLKMLLDKHAKGQTGVKEVKRESRTAAQGKAYKNVTYNETKHRYVGKNRLGKK